MKTQIHDSLTELHEFIEDQAREDAVLTPSERKYQAELVADVLAQEPLKPSVYKKLLHDYSEGVASRLSHKRLAA